MNSSFRDDRAVAEPLSFTASGSRLAFLGDQRALRVQHSRSFHATIIARAMLSEVGNDLVGYSQGELLSELGEPEPHVDHCRRSSLLFG